MRLFISALFLSLAAAAVSAQGPAPDSPALWDDSMSDGCSLWPDGNYRDCCVAHDGAYFRGGGLGARREADRLLYRCVRSKGRGYNPIIAPLMWIGVRIGGVGWLPTPFRWGFGNRYPAMRPDRKAGKGDKGR